MLDPKPLSARIGAEIRTTADRLASGADAAEIRRILEGRGVVCLPGLHLSDAQQIAFAKTLGAISEEAPDGIFKVSADAGVNPNAKLASYQRGSFYWHFDGFERDAPYLATMLNPQALSESGGETEFANLYAAYEDLPEAEQRELEGLRVVHSFETVMRIVVPWPSFADVSEWQQRPPKSQPLVWRQKSGRTSLMVGSSASHIEGMSLEKGRALLCRLNEWATQPQYVYRHHWTIGDLVIWNNTGTLHRAMPYPLNSGRLMHRTTLLGEETTFGGDARAAAAPGRNMVTPAA